MQTFLRLSVLFCLLVAAPVSAVVQPDPNSAGVKPPPREGPVQSYGKLPLSFEANHGQTDPKVKFLSRGEGYQLYLTPTEAVLALTKRPADGGEAIKAEEAAAALRMKLIGADPHPKISGEAPLPGKMNYFIGKDRSKWRSDVPTYGKVKYDNIYPGIGLIYYGNQRRLEYDFVVAPGADPRKIALAFEGADQVSIDSKGNLVLKVSGGEVQFLKPSLYQEADGTRREISGRYILKGKNNVGFQVAGYDRSRPLIIDPILSYSTFLGGSGDEAGVGIAVDSAGNAYVVGRTFSSNFPVTAAAFQKASQGFDTFVSKLNPSGTALIYSAFLGGSGSESSQGVAIDSAGNAYITGYTDSTDYPATAGAYQPAWDSSFPASFVSKLNPSGSALVYSTYLSGTSAEAIAVDASGNAYITGSVGSNDLSRFSTTPGAFQRLHGGGDRDAFVVELNAAGSALIYSTYLGGSGRESAFSIAVDGSGHAYLTGNTDSADFPLVTPIQAVIGGKMDLFIVKINPAGARLDYATFFGGNDHENGWGIALDAAGNAYLTGTTASSDFPATPGAFQPRGSGTISYDDPDSFVLKINSLGNAVVYASYLGGRQYDYGNGIVVDGAGNAYVAGVTASNDFPTVRSIKSSLAGSECRFGDCPDAFIVRVNAGGDALTFSTYLGGSFFDNANAVAIDALRNIYLTGATWGNLPVTPGAFQTRPNGITEAFVTKISESRVPARFTADPPVAGVPLTVHFEATGSSESGAAIVSYLWDFGDGATGSGPKIDHTYTEEGGYTIVLTVTDANGEKGSAHGNITASDFILNIAPDAGTVIPGNSGTSTVFVGIGGPGYLTVDLTCATPSGVGLGCSMNPTSAVPRSSEGRSDPGATSTLTVTTQPSTPAGNYPITVAGRTGGAVHEATYFVNVKPGDSFNRADGTNLGSNWNEIVPDLELFNNQIRNKDTGSKAAIFNWPIGPDQDVSADCKVTAANNACGVMARWSNAGNYYYARIDVGQRNLVLFKSVNGVVTELGRKELPPEGAAYDTYFPVRLVARGSSLSASVVIMIDDSGCSFSPCTVPATYQVTATDGALTVGDYAGIGSFAAADFTPLFYYVGATRPDAPVPAGVLFTDEFDRTTGLGARWKITAGSYTTDGTFAVSGTAANWAAVTPNLGTNEYMVESVLTVPAGSLYSGIVARGNPSAFSSDLYSVQLATDGKVNLYRRNAGVWTLLKGQAAGIAAGTRYTVALKVSGTNPVNLEVFLNGSPLFTSVDASAARILSGIPGIENYDGGVKYDRFTVFSNQSPDTAPPVPPGFLSASATGSRQVDLSWPPAKDNVAVAGYHLFRNGALIATLDAGTTVYSDTGLTPETTYPYGVSAFDRSKNESARTQATVTTPPIGLRSIIVAPADPTIRTGGSQQFKATGNYNDDTAKDLTGSVDWSAAEPAIAAVGNQAGNKGRATGLSAGTTSIFATDPATGIYGWTSLTVQPQPAPGFSDTFDRPNSTNLGPSWYEYLPNLEIFANQLRNVDAGSKAAVWNQPLGSDHEVSVDCYMTATANSCGVMGRWSNADNFYRARIDAGADNVTLFKTVNGATTQLGTASRPIAYSTFYRVRLVIKGNALQVFFSNESAPAISVTDGALPEGTFVGIRSASSAAGSTGFNNFSAASASGAGNQPPAARFTANPASGPAPLAVHFDASASSDDGTFQTFHWDFGDGVTKTTPVSSETTEYFFADHTYPSAGSYTVTLTITDNQGATGSARTALTVTSGGSAILFEESFNRTTGLGADWKVTAGHYSTDGNFAVSSGATSWAQITKSLSTNDYTVESTLTVPAGSLYSGIVARGNPSAFSSDLYSAQIATDGKVNLYRRNAGTWTLLSSASAGITANQAYTLKLKVTGSNPVNLAVSLDGAALFSFPDASASRILSGVPGIENYNSGVKYDRFTVTGP